MPFPRAFAAWKSSLQYWGKLKRPPRATRERQSTWFMAVAVVLSDAGNQVDEISGGAAITVTPVIPFRMAHTWQLWKGSQIVTKHFRTSQGKLSHCWCICDHSARQCRQPWDQQREAQFFANQPAWRGVWQKLFYVYVYLYHLGQRDNRKHKHDGSPISKHCHSWYTPIKSISSSSLNWSPGVPDDALQDVFELPRDSCKLFSPDDKPWRKTGPGYTSALYKRVTLVYLLFLPHGQSPVWNHILL